ncbi:hypothetical protein L3X38_002264 [Prunus dulcis]|uniref:Transposable element protein n=1 Tax=Prunus dulcis TaxID=3755 RepID=A0AAD4WW08_PRUDU|nr:hypothetical protein L3X38_002264 [Prunus dulcis]
MLEYFSSHAHYCFLDGYSGYNQIFIAPKDQEKTTFTCSFGTFAYRRMPFGLCNALATFHRFMMAIFSDMVEQFIEILLLQELDLEIRDKKGSENVVANYLSRIVVEEKGLDLLPLDETFPDEQLYVANTKEPWYVDFVNYLACGVIRNDLTSHDKKFFSMVKHYIWDEPFLFKHCLDILIRKSIAKEEQESILKHSHKLACGGHFGAKKTALKILQSGLFWPTLFKDAFNFCVNLCDRCQMMGNISRGNQMTWNNILIVELFDVWGIDCRNICSHNNVDIIINMPIEPYKIDLHTRVTIL